jgi:hypothetical protein
MHQSQAFCWVSKEVLNSYRMMGLSRVIMAAMKSPNQCKWSGAVATRARPPEARSYGSMQLEWNFLRGTVECSK